MPEDDDRLEVKPVPLPKHEREGRHPSEIGQSRRAIQRRPAPPLNPVVASLAGGLGLALIVAVVALVVPRDAQRESTPTVRNAAGVTTRGATATDAAPPGFLVDDGSRFVIAVDHADRTFLVSTNQPEEYDEVYDEEYDLEVIARDEDLGLVVLAGGNPPRSSVVATSTVAPASGTDVIVRTGPETSGDVAAVIGIAVKSDTSRFVPLGGDVANVDVPEAAVVVDPAGKALGLFTTREGAIGFVPMAAVESLLSRLD
ncbi:MAG: hypothetical protein RLZZ368_547 [Actinomycetota bacterium]